MAGGKESPRQKMIGMMYLVLTALLALNVSKEILQGFVMVDESIEKSKLILDENNFRVQKAFEDYVKNGNYEAKPYLLKSVETQKNIRVVDAYIDSVKKIIASKTEKKNLTDTSQMRFMENIDNYDVPTHLMIGSDASRPIQTKYSAKDLRLQLTNLHKNLIVLIDNMQKETKTKLDDESIRTLKQKLNTIKPTDRATQKGDVKSTWELQNFYHMPMAAVITNLDKIQADLKNVESEFLHTFAAASSKFDFKVDKLQAKVVAPSAYVLSGQTFKADIVLGASSSELTSDRMEVLIGAEYDTVSKKLTNPGAAIAVKDGMGNYETNTSAIGEKSLKGVIRYKNPRGEDEFYPFDFPYMVAPPFTAVAADYMNIFYAGISNPITVSAAGFAPSQLKVTVSGCGATISKDEKGNYQVSATSAGTCIVTVAANTAQGLKQQGPAKYFKVKDIPPPILKVGGKLANTDLIFTRNEAKNISTLGAESVGFVANIPMPVKSFKVDVGGQGEYPCVGNSLSNDAKQAIAKMRVGQWITISDVKVLSPKKAIISIASASIKVKS